MMKIKIKIMMMTMAIIAITFFLCLPVDADEITENENDLQVSSMNNNYLGMGAPGELQRSEGKLNSHINSMPIPMIIPGEYNSAVYTDHTWNPEILEFLLESNGLRRFRIEVKKMYFTIKTTKSKVGILKDQKYACDFVYAFRDRKDMAAHVKDGILIGHTTTYASSGETLIDTFNQAVIDCGEMGANVMMVLKYQFVIGTVSSTVGLGSSGVTGLLGGSKQASSFGSALGYAKGKARPVTFSFIQAMCFYSENLK